MKISIDLRDEQGAGRDELLFALGAASAILLRESENPPADLPPGVVPALARIGRHLKDAAHVAVDLSHAEDVPPVPFGETEVLGPCDTFNCERPAVGRSKGGFRRCAVCLQERVQ